MASIFISYRRGATEDITYRIYEKLKEHFGDVFIDIDNIPAGVRFPDHLASVLEVCDVVLAVIGPDWLTPRLADPDDFLRQELEVAIERELTVIPVLVRGATIPRLDDVPTSLLNLLEFQAVTVASASDFSAHVKRLITNIENGRARAALAAEAARAASAAEAEQRRKEAEERRQEEEARRLSLEAEERTKQADERRLRASEQARSAPTRTAGRARFHILGSVGSDLLTEHFVAESRSLEGFQKRVIIRRLHPRLSDKKRVVGMFLDEARLAGHLNHANVHSVIDVAEGADSYFCVYDYLDYESLETIVSGNGDGNRKPLDIFVSVYICREVCRALEYAHSATNNGSALGIIHRDITPANVYLVYDGRVVLSGFGLAKAATDLEEIEPSEAKCKSSYLSPEVASGEAATAATDIFSLGIMLWELVAGRRLFAADSDLATLRMIQGFIEPPRLRDLRPDYEGQLDSVLSSLTARDPAQRLDARQARAALDAVLRRAAAYVTVDDVSTLVAEHRALHGRVQYRSLESEEHGLAAQSILEFTSIEPQAASQTVSPVVADHAETGLGDARSSSSSRGRVAPLSMLAGAVLLVGVTAWVTRYRSPSPLPVVIAATIAPPLPPSPSAVEDEDGPEREVALVLFPLDARVLLGDKDLGQMPVSLKVREGKPLKVRIVRDGYWTRKLTLDGTKKRVVIGLVKRDGSANPNPNDDDPPGLLPRSVPSR